MAVTQSVLVSLLLTTTAVFLTTPSVVVVLSQGPITPVPTINGCTMRLLTLTPCGPFVQGVAETVSQPCCDNLRLLHVQQPDCLCLFLNDTSLINSPLPINKTLALELPHLCALQVDDSSACPGVPVPHNSSGSQVSLGARNNSIVAASPVVQAAPRPIIMGIGLGRSAEDKTQDSYAVLAVAALLSAMLVV